MNCRICNIEIDKPFLSLGSMPLSNSLIIDLSEEEKKYPLDIYYCPECHFIQTPEFETAKNIFSDGYPYFSSYSKTWLEHCKKYVDTMMNRYKYDENSLVVEIGSNDGGLLQYFKGSKVPVLGVEPVMTAAKLAIDKNIPTQVDYFDREYALMMVENNTLADLIIGNNVLAHNPDLHSFVEGLKIILKPDGIITMEFPYLLNLIRQNQFDTIYHEHFSYLSLYSVIKLFNIHKLDIFDVEEIPIHGGSLRIYARHFFEDDRGYKISNSVPNLLEKEIELRDIKTYINFHIKTELVKKNFLDLLKRLKKENKRVVAYSAPAKGNTLLNYCGIGTDLIKYATDANPYKQGKFMPGSHIPIISPDIIELDKPDYIIILAWNIADEIIKQLKYTMSWGCKFIIPIPDPYIL